MTADYDLAPDELFDVEEDEPFPFAMIPDWVMLHADLKSRDIHIYGLLRAHVVHARRDNEAWPSQAKLAAVLGLSKTDPVSESIGRLERVGALRKKMRTGPKGRFTVYVMRPRPEQELAYDGLRSVWDLHRPGVFDELVATRVKRLPHRQKSATAIRESSDNRRSEDIPPNPGGSSERVTPDLGVPPDQGSRVPPDRGVNPEILDPDVLNEPPVGPPPPQPPVDGTAPDLFGAIFDGEPESDVDPDVAQAIAAAALASRRDTRRRRSPAMLDATAASGPAWTLVRRVVEGRTVARDELAKIRARVSALLGEGIAAEHVAAGLEEMLDRGYSSGSLPGFVTSAANRKPRVAPSDARDARMRDRFANLPGGAPGASPGGLDPGGLFGPVLALHAAAAAQHDGDILDAEVVDQ